MIKNKLMLIVLLVFLTFSLLLCGFVCGRVKGDNLGESIVKNTKIYNTLANLRDIYPQNVRFVSGDENTIEKPKIQPYTKDNERIKKGKNSVSASKSVNTATGEILIEATSKRVLYQNSADIKMYPASTTKVLTALCVLHNLSLDRVVIVPKAAEGVEGSSLYLKAGQKVSVEDLLYGLMLRSGNDAAVTLAIETSGSIDAFASLMNETAKECGAVNSNFVNPHGLQDENHYTTAYDLAMITAKAYKNKDFVRIVSSKLKKITIDDTQIVIANKNKMLKIFEGANGVKTGFTKSSGRCLVSGAMRGDMQLISVVLNCGNMWNESVRLLNYGFDNYKMIPLDEAILTNGESEILVKIKSTVCGDWRNIKYPIRRDGSEKLIVSIG